MHPASGQCRHWQHVDLQHTLLHAANCHKISQNRLVQAKSCQKDVNFIAVKNLTCRTAANMEDEHYYLISASEPDLATNKIRQRTRADLLPLCCSCIATRHYHVVCGQVMSGLQKDLTICSGVGTPLNTTYSAMSSSSASGRGMAAASCSCFSYSACCCWSICTSGGARATCSTK